MSKHKTRKAIQNFNIFAYFVNQKRKNKIRESDESQMSTAHASAGCRVCFVFFFSLPTGQNGFFLSRTEGKSYEAGKPAKKVRVVRHMVGQKLKKSVFLEKYEQGERERRSTRRRWTTGGHFGSVTGWRQRKKLSSRKPPTSMYIISNV